MKTSTLEDDNRLVNEEKEQRSKLDAALLSGLESGTPVLFDNDAFKDRMRIKYQQ